MGLSDHTCCYLCIALSLLAPRTVRRPRSVPESRFFKGPRPPGPQLLTVLASRTKKGYVEASFGEDVYPRVTKLLLHGA